MHADVVVIGAGLIGAASAWALAKEGHKVLVIDQFTPVNNRNASNGLSRVFRHFNGTDEMKFCMTLAARKLWGEISAQSDERFWFPKPKLMLGDSFDEELRVGAEMMEYAGLRPEVYETSSSLRMHYPLFHAEAGVLDRTAAVIHPTLAVKAFLKAAKRLGAQVLTQRKVGDICLGWVSLEDGTNISCGQIVIAAGSWSDRLACDSLRLKTTKQEIVFFKPKEDRFRRPSFIEDFPMFTHFTSGFYGFPPFGGEGFKIANHYRGVEMDPDDNRGEARFDFIRSMTSFLRRVIPVIGNVGEMRSTTCHYTMTPDKEFIIDHLDPNTVVATGFCGEGAKFAPLVGHLVADLIAGRESQFDLRRFKIS